MKTYSVAIAGGGPVGLTLAHELARRGIDCLLVERNFETTQHPKMDITNGRSMELFRMAGLERNLRAAAVPEDHPFDVSWVTTMAGHELHRFRYASVTDMRKRIGVTNDGTSALEPPMRVSQVEIEPVLKSAAEAQKLATIRFGVAFETLEQDADGVTVRLKNQENGTEEIVRCRYLVGCDGGGSRVSECVGIEQSGQRRIMPRFMTHFRSDARDLLQRWGIAWHYQSANGTMIAQNDRDVWTLHSRGPATEAETVDPSSLIRAFVGADITHQILVANRWSPHLLVADRFGDGRVLLAGDAAHQYIPTGGYGMNTGIGDAMDLGWKLAAVIHGFAGAAITQSYEPERRPVALRNREGSGRHNEVRVKIGQMYSPEIFGDNNASADKRRQTSEAIALLGNAENESFGLELGYVYEDSPIIPVEPHADRPEGDPVRYVPTTRPGARLPSTMLRDGTALYDRLGPWFTLIAFASPDEDGFVQAAHRLGIPFEVAVLFEPEVAPVYEAKYILVRPDHHVVWRGDTLPDARQAETILSTVLAR